MEKLVWFEDNRTRLRLTRAKIKSTMSTFVKTSARATTREKKNENFQFHLKFLASFSFRCCCCARLSTILITMIKWIRSVMKDDKLPKRCEVKIRFSMFIRAESKVFGMNGRKQTNNEKPTKKTKPMKKQKMECSENLRYMWIVVSVKFSEEKPLTKSLQIFSIFEIIFDEIWLFFYR